MCAYVALDNTSQHNFANSNRNCERPARLEGFLYSKYSSLATCVAFLRNMYVRNYDLVLNVYNNLLLSILACSANKCDD